MSLLIATKPLDQTDLALFVNLLNSSWYTRDKRHFTNGYIDLLSSFISALPEQNSINAHPEFPQYLNAAVGLFQFLLESKM